MSDCLGVLDARDVAPAFLSFFTVSADPFFAVSESQFYFPLFQLVRVIAINEIGSGARLG